MSESNNGLPQIPEEDLDLHQNFEPIIAPNGRIRRTGKKPEKVTVPEDSTFTQMDTLQDLVQIRSGADEEKQSVQKEAEITEKPAKEKPAPKPEPDEKPVSKEAVVKPYKRVEQPAPLKEELNPRMQKLPEQKVSKSSPSSKAQPANQADTRKPATALPPKTPVSNAKQMQQTAPKKHRRWLWVVGILCFLFLGMVGGLVPVEKIPLLRELAYAMGFTPAGTQRMSFLRALLTWTDQTIGLPGEWGPQESRSALWARLHGGQDGQEGEEANGLYARMARNSGRTSLINMQALAARQRQQGRSVDAIRNSVSPIEGDESNPDPATLRDNNVNVRTEANQDKGDVYFGSDTSAINRNFQDGYDSVKTLAKIKNPHIANGEPIDWLANVTQRMMKMHPGMAGLSRTLESMHVNWGGNIKATGDEKPQRDLYYAWITSRMSKYTSNLMMKKALANSGFMGADIPTLASNVLDFSGVQIDSEALEADQAAWKEYLEFEEKCNESLATHGKIVDEKIDEFNNLVEAGPNWDFPTNCAASNARETSYDSSKFSGQIQEIETICETLQTAYNPLRTDCRMQVSEGQECETIIHTYEGRWMRFQSKCESMYNTELEKWLAKWQNDHAQEIANNGWDEATWKQKAKQDFDTAADGWKKIGQGYTQKQYIAEEVDSTQENMLDVVIDQHGGGSEYFPKPDIKQTIENHLAENKAF